MRFSLKKYFFLDFGSWPRAANIHVAGKVSGQRVDVVLYRVPFLAARPSKHLTFSDFSCHSSAVSCYKHVRQMAVSRKRRWQC